MSASHEKSPTEVRLLQHPNSSSQHLFDLYLGCQFVQLWPVGRWHLRPEWFICWSQTHLSQNGDILLKWTLQTYSCFPASFPSKQKYHIWEFTMSFQANILKKTCDVCDIVGYFAGFILQSGQVNDFGASIATYPASSQRAFRMSLDLSISHDLPKKPCAVGWPFICKYTMRNNSACPLHILNIILLMVQKSCTSW